MKRRNFMFMSSVGITAIAVPTWYYTSQLGDDDQLFYFPRQLSAIWSAETIIEIGHLYKEKYPTEQEEKILIKLIMEDISDQSSNLEELINQKIKLDYEKENIVIIDGWLLSVTEARQCALYSLRQNS